jgi:hypothetical protein
LLDGLSNDKKKKNKMGILSKVEILYRYFSLPNSFLV